MIATVLLSVLALIQTPPTAVVLPEESALTAAIAERDSEMFSVMFARCDPAALADLVTADFEFYHDKGGRIVGRDAFVADYRAGCETWQEATAWRTRRTLVTETLRVYPIPGYGAVEEGTHLFHERQGDGPEGRGGSARFSIVWALEDGRWRAARALSVDHAPLPE